MDWNLSRLLALVFLLSACTSREGLLTMDSTQVGLLLGVITSSSKDALKTNSPTVSANLAGSSTCGTSGTIDMTGRTSGTVVTENGPPIVKMVDLRWNMGLTLTACRIRAANGTTYTLDGSLTIDPGTFSGTETADEITPTLATPELDSSLDVSGTISIAGGNADIVNCEISLRITNQVGGTKQELTHTGTYEGTGCGDSVSGRY